MIIPSDLVVPSRKFMNRAHMQAGHEIFLLTSAAISFVSLSEAYECKALNGVDAKMLMLPFWTDPSRAEPEAS